MALQGWDAFKTYGLGWPNSKKIGLEKLKTPAVQEPEELETDFNSDAYMKDLAKKSGYEKSIIAGRKKPKLSTQTMLG
jgi:hypothetical protein